MKTEIIVGGSLILFYMGFCFVLGILAHRMHPEQKITELGFLLLAVFLWAGITSSILVTLGQFAARYLK